MFSSFVGKYAFIFSNLLDMNMKNKLLCINDQIRARLQLQTILLKFLFILTINGVLATYKTVLASY